MAHQILAPAYDRRMRPRRTRPHARLSPLQPGRMRRRRRRLLAPLMVGIAALVVAALVAFPLH
jgi:hypothetical protein